jgi:hypothetical protein
LTISSRFHTESSGTINGYWNDSTEVKVSLPKDETLSQLSLNLSGVGSKYIVDLLNEKRSEVLRSYIITSDSMLLFPYLKAGKYSVRVTEDKNGNGIVDSGNLLAHRQPEKVMFITFDGKDVINIPERSEIEQAIDIAALFLNRRIK